MQIHLLTLLVAAATAAASPLDLVKRVPTPGAPAIPPQCSPYIPLINNPNGRDAVLAKRTCSTFYATQTATVTSYVTQTSVANSVVVSTTPTTVTAPPSTYRVLRQEQYTTVSSTVTETSYTTVTQTSLTGATSSLTFTTSTPSPVTTTTTVTVTQGPTVTVTRGQTTNLLVETCGSPLTKRALPSAGSPSSTTLDAASMKAQILGTACPCLGMRPPITVITNTITATSTAFSTSIARPTVTVIPPAVTTTSTYLYTFGATTAIGFQSTNSVTLTSTQVVATTTSIATVQSVTTKPPDARYTITFTLGAPRVTVTTTTTLTQTATVTTRPPDATPTVFDLMLSNGRFVSQSDPDDNRLFALLDPQSEGFYLYNNLMYDVATKRIVHTDYRVINGQITAGLRPYLNSQIDTNTVVIFTRNPSDNSLTFIIGAGTANAPGHALVLADNANTLYWTSVFHQPFGTSEVGMRAVPRC